MTESYPLRPFDTESSETVQAALENSEIVYFQSCPFPLPAEEDLVFLREELPLQSKITRRVIMGQVMQMVTRWRHIAPIAMAFMTLS